MVVVAKGLQTPSMSTCRDEEKTRMFEVLPYPEQFFLQMIESFQFPKSFAFLPFQRTAQCAKFTILDSQKHCWHLGKTDCQD